MTICPFCGFTNIEGDDTCQQCGASLSDLHLQPPLTEVERHLLKDRVGDLQPSAPIAVTPDTSLSDTINLLVDRGIGCVLVMQGEELVGIFSERDALKKVNTRMGELGSNPISEFMTPAPQTLEGHAKVAFAVQQMDLGGYRHLPILDEAGKASGVISVRNLLNYLTERMTS